MKQIAVDSSMKKLSIEALTLQIDPAVSPLASFLLVLSFYGESLGGRGFLTVLATTALQAPLDRARGELPSDTRTLIFHWEKFRGKIGEIWRSVIASNRLHEALGGRVRHTRTISSFLGSLAALELFRSLLRSMIT